MNWCRLPATFFAVMVNEIGRSFDPPRKVVGREMEGWGRPWEHERQTIAWVGYGEETKFLTLADIDARTTDDPDTVADKMLFYLYRNKLPVETPRMHPAINLKVLDRFLETGRQDPL